MLGWLGNAFLAFLYHGVPLLTGQPGHQPPPRPLALRPVELRGDRCRAGSWCSPASASRSNGPSSRSSSTPFVVLGLVLAAVQFLPAFFARGLESLYVSSWYILGGAGLHAARLSDGQHRAGVCRRRQRRGVQRALDPRRRSDCSSRRSRSRSSTSSSRPSTAPADLQPLPVDARVLAAVLSLSAERHAPLRVLGDPDGGADRRDRRLGPARRRRGHRRDQPVPVAARRRHRSARSRAALRRHRHAVLPHRQRAGRRCRRRWR